MPHTKRGAAQRDPPHLNPGDGKNTGLRYKLK